MKFEWELVSKDEGELYTIANYRAKVIGGWIVKDLTSISTKVSYSMVFIPDPKHEWVID